MAISIDWGTKVIFVPKADTQLISLTPIEIRSLDLNNFRLELKALEALAEGMPYERTHVHNTAVTVGGVTLARVVEIINNYTVTFEDGPYAVNLVGANSNVGDVINFNQVSVRSSNSAGLTFSEEINNQSYIGAAVYINSVSGLPGINFPRGTPTDPVNNFPDAYQIAQNRKFNNYHLGGNNFILTNLDVIAGSHWVGESIKSSILTLVGEDSTNCSFLKIGLKGVLNGEVFAEFCELENLSNVSGIFYKCLFKNSITLDNTAVDLISFIDCNSSVAGPSPAIVDANNTTADIQFRNYTGGLNLENITEDINVSVDVLSGNVIISPSCTNGTIVIRGVTSVTDNSGPGCTVVYTSSTVGPSLQTLNDGIKKSSLFIPHTDNI